MYVQTVGHAVSPRNIAWCTESLTRRLISSKPAITIDLLRHESRCSVWLTINAPAIVEALPQFSRETRSHQQLSRIGKRVAACIHEYGSPATRTAKWTADFGIVVNLRMRLNEGALAGTTPHGATLHTVNPNQPK
jgi:hypothetical protein